MAMIGATIPDYEDQAPEGAELAICQLPRTMRAFVWASRCLAFGAMDPDDVGQHLESVLGQAAPVALAHHYVFLKLAAEAVRPKRMTMHHPACPCLGSDENSLARCLMAFGAGQYGAATQALQCVVGKTVPMELVQIASDLALLYAEPASFDQVS